MVVFANTCFCVQIVSKAAVVQIRLGGPVRQDRHYKEKAGRHRAVARKKVTPLYVAAIAVAAVLLFVGARAAFHHMGEAKLFEGEEVIGDTVAGTNEFIEKFGESERVNILLLGVSEGLTDTVMVASYDMKNQLVDLISVPRDVYYPREGHSGASNKLNAIYHSKDGGVTEVARVVSDILDGMAIHYYMLVDYEGVANIVDAIGGVTFQVPFHMKYEDRTKGKELYVDIPAGEQVITKKNVVPFLRFRQTNPWYAAKGYKDYGSMDIGRMETQQAFMKASLKQSIGPNFVKVVKAVLKNVESDLDLEMALKLTEKAAGLDAQNVTSHTLPGKSAMREKASVWVLDEDGVEELLNEIYLKAENGGQPVTSEAAVETF